MWEFKGLLKVHFFLLRFFSNAQKGEGRVKRKKGNFLMLISIRRDYTQLSPSLLPP
jgi:hypothetical protein